MFERSFNMTRFLSSSRDITYYTRLHVASIYNQHIIMTNNATTRYNEFVLICEEMENKKTSDSRITNLGIRIGHQSSLSSRVLGLLASFLPIPMKVPFLCHFLEWEVRSWPSHLLQSWFIYMHASFPKWTIWPSLACLEWELLEELFGKAEKVVVPKENQMNHGPREGTTSLRPLLPSLS